MNFDTNPRHASILLPILWDGEIPVRGSVLRLGKVVIALAGSREEVSDLLVSDDWLSQEDDRLRDWPKLPDLRSRINAGHVGLPGFDRTKANRQVDKLLVFLSLLSQRFRRLQSWTVPLALLQFVAKSDFEYSSRSVGHLVDRLPAPSDDDGNLTAAQIESVLTSPPIIRESGLIHHLTRTANAKDIEERWTICQNGVPEIRVTFCKKRCEPEVVLAPRGAQRRAARGPRRH